LKAIKLNFKPSKQVNPVTLFCLYSPFHKRKTEGNDVNIFRENIYCVTIFLSTLCKTYCFAFQKRLFCIPKAALLHGKSVGFASQKSRFRNVKAQLSLFKRIIFTKLSLFFYSISVAKGKSKGVR